jgi:hypothetical protein
MEEVAQMGWPYWTTDYLLHAQLEVLYANAFSWYVKDLQRHNPTISDEEAEMKAQVAVHALGWKTHREIYNQSLGYEWPDLPEKDRKKQERENEARAGLDEMYQPDCRRIRRWQNLYASPLCR